MYVFVDIMFDVEHLVQTIAYNFPAKTKQWTNQLLLDERYPVQQRSLSSERIADKGRIHQFDDSTRKASLRR